MLKKLIDISILNKIQKNSNDIVNQHFHDNVNKQLLMIISAQSGLGKSFLIYSLKQLLTSSCLVCSYFGIAALKILEKILHIVLKLPIKGKKCNAFKGNWLSQLKIALSSIK